jgi:hypothetical protein
MRQIALSLLPFVSLTLADYGAGWRFQQWTRAGAPTLPRPSETDLLRCFKDLNEAASHFRQAYAALPSDPPRASKGGLARRR